MDADFVIIGGGTAGCVLANRLSVDPLCRVVMIEAGDEAVSPWIAMPAGTAKLYHHPRLNWRYRTEPEPSLGGRQLFWPRGKVLGGTSSINGMTYVRGQPADYDAWGDLTGGAWSWRNVLPYFKRLEDSAIGVADNRGRGGPMQIGTISERHALSQAFLEAGVAAGVPLNEDYNGPTQEGIAFTQVMMRNGVRSSAASAYLAPVRGRRNLRVLTRSLVRRIHVESGRAVGVEVERGAHVHVVHARREVLLCGGAIASPQLLMLSGIGDTGELSALGIPVVADRPQVGRNLQEHVRAQLVYRMRISSINRDARGLRLARHVAHYLWRKRGLLTTTASQVNGFVRSSPAVERPDLQLVFRPSSGEYRDGRFSFHDFPGVMGMVVLLRPKSRGHIGLRSASARDAPRIVAGHLSEPQDFEPLLHGIRLLRLIFASPPLAGAVVDEVKPGRAVDNDDALRSFLRNTADSSYHAVGTCAMGADDASVTTPELRVRGVDGLRVVDASVMPLVPSGNTAAAVLMIAERAADLLHVGAATPATGAHG